MRTLRTAAVSVTLLIGLTACVAPADTSSKKSTAAPVPAVTGDQQPSGAPAPAGDGDKLKDAKITACKVDDVLGWPSAELTVTNHSSKTSNYMIQVEFLDEAGTRVGEGIAATNNLAASQSANLKAQGAADSKGKKLSCRVTDVTRYASP